MDGLLVLVLIGWVFFRMNKAASGIQKEKASRRKQERHERIQTELAKSRVQLTQEKKAVQLVALREGEATAVYTPMEAPFRGSMQTESTEGECICDPELEHEREKEPAPTSVYAGEIGKEPLVDFSARGVLQGFVMSEILTRPAQRARRH